MQHIGHYEGAILGAASGQHILHTALACFTVPPDLKA